MDIIENTEDVTDNKEFNTSDFPDNTSVPFLRQTLLFLSETSGPPPLGFHLLMGKTAKEKLLNQARNLEENRVTVVQGTALKN